MLVIWVYKVIYFRFNLVVSFEFLLSSYILLNKHDLYFMFIHVSFHKANIWLEQFACDHCWNSVFYRETYDSWLSICWRHKWPAMKIFCIFPDFFQFSDCYLLMRGRSVSYFIFVVCIFAESFLVCLFRTTFETCLCSHHWLLCLHYF